MAGMPEPVTGPCVMLRMSSVGHDTAAQTATCGLTSRQIHKFHNGSSRHVETYLFHPYIQRVKEVSPTVIVHLVQRLDDVTSGAVVLLWK